MMQLLRLPPKKVVFCILAIGLLFDVCVGERRNGDNLRVLEATEMKGMYSKSCPTPPSYPAILTYSIPGPGKSSSTRGSGFQGNRRDHCDDLTRASNSCCMPLPSFLTISHTERAQFATRVCPCGSTSRFNIVNSKEKAENIVLTRASEKYLAVCRNSRICVGGFQESWRFRKFDTRTGKGPCRRWIGGDVASCDLEMLTRTEKIPGGWRVKVRATIAEGQWTIPVRGLFSIDRDFKRSGENIDLSTMTVAELEIASHQAPRQVLVVGTRGLSNDVLSYDINCVEVGRAFPIESGPPTSLPDRVKRKESLSTTAFVSGLRESDHETNRDAPYARVYDHFEGTLNVLRPKDETIEKALADIADFGFSVGVGNGAE